MALSLAATSPAVAVHGRGLAKDALGQKRKRVWCMGEVMALSLAATSPAVDGRGLAKDARGQKRNRVWCRGEVTSPRKDTNDTLDECLWRWLPEDVFDVIFEHLSFAAKSRFRCVAQRWKGFPILSPPPPVCTIVSKAGDQKAMFHCDAERKWISLPCSSHLPRGGTWEFVDSDAGLVCFQCDIDGWFWLWVCNPLKPSLSRLIGPKYERRGPQTRIRQAPTMKLLVDRASGTYRIVAKLDELPCTAVYESKTSRWTGHDGCSPGMWSQEFFVWGGKLYAYNSRYPQGVFPLLKVFDTKKPTWKCVPVKIPCEVNFPTNRFFLSNNKEVILVLCSDGKLYRPYLSVWKLLDGSANFAPASFSMLENWRKIEIGSERAVVDLRGHRLASASFDGEHICFAFGDDGIKRDGSRGSKCVRYSLTAKIWSEMPSCRFSGESFGLCTWEPNLDIDPS